VWLAVAVFYLFGYINILISARIALLALLIAVSLNFLLSYRRKKRDERATPRNPTRTPS
jgi:NADH:ubiquinone oxidoreductase subunit 3 (subunit A)